MGRLRTMFVRRLSGPGSMVNKYYQSAKPRISQLRLAVTLVLPSCDGHHPFYTLGYSYTAPPNPNRTFCRSASVVSQAEMENTSLQRLFDAFPNEDHDSLEPAANRYYFQRDILGPVPATRNLFLSFPTSFPGVVFWTDEVMAQSINPRLKKTAVHCFGYLADKPTPEQITAIIERARRGLGSCSNCYQPKDRGADKHCIACHTR